MSDKNINIDEFDLMMKSILDEAQEEVPERVWEGISVGLDKAEHKKTVVLWWKRSAIAVAAAAAVILGVFFLHNIDNEFVPDTGSGEIIAVVKTDEDITEPVEETIADEPETFILLADSKQVSGKTVTEIEAAEVFMVPDNAADAIEASDAADVTEVEENSRIIDSGEEVVENEYFPEDWGKDEVKRRRDVALVISGIAGTNNAMNQNKFGAMMRPEVVPAPKVTGIEETSTKSSFGIPLSFGAGVKFDISPRWSIGTGLNYTFLSRQFYGKYTKIDNAGNIERVISSDIRNQQHYLGVPVNVFYDIISNDRINFYAYAGGAVEKCLSDSYRLLNTRISHKENVEGVQLSANAGIGVEFMLGKHLGLYIDPSIRYYFDNDQPKSVRTVQPLMLGFEMGLRARL